MGGGTWTMYRRHREAAAAVAGRCGKAPAGHPECTWMDGAVPVCRRATDNTEAVTRDDRHELYRQEVNGKVGGVDVS